MPVVKIDTRPLKEDNKPVLIKKITDVFTGMGLPAQAVTVIINEIPKKKNWGQCG